MLVTTPIAFLYTAVSMTTILVVTLMSSGGDDLIPMIAVTTTTVLTPAIMVEKDMLSLSLATMRHVSTLFAKVGLKVGKDCKTPGPGTGNSRRLWQITSGSRPLAAEKHPWAGQRLRFHKSARGNSPRGLDRK